VTQDRVELGPVTILLGDAAIWHGCYDDGWGMLITPESFAHPAKFARGLIERIIRHGLERGYWREGQLLGDPFGGVALGGIIAAYHGLAWIGVELEPKFVALGQANIDLHAGKLAQLGAPIPVILQGDSRNFAEIVQGAAGICTSPPYSGMAPEKSGPGINIDKQWETYRASGGGMSLEKFRAQQERHSHGYGSADGQIGSLPAGDLAGVLTSPPYAETEVTLAQRDGNFGDLENMKKHRKGRDEMGRRYSKADGQIGNLKSGDLQGICTSPPFEKCMASGVGMEANGRQVTSERKEKVVGFGVSEGQIGADAGDSYWQAMAQVYGQCLLALKPGGVMAVVIKSFVKAGKIVPLPDQTWQLLLHLGFLPLERVRAMLVKERETAGLFGQVKTKKERKSFFRRLAEKKGSPAIDFEEVLFVQAQADNPAGGLFAAEGATK